MREVGYSRRPKLLSTFKGMGNARVAIFVQGKHCIITGGDCKFLIVWGNGVNIETYSDIYIHPVCSDCVSLCITGDQKFIIAGHKNGTVGIYGFAVDDGEIHNHYCFSSAHRNHVTGVKFDDNANWILSCSRDKSFTYFHAGSHERMAQFDFNSECTALEYDASKKFAYVGMADGRIHMIHCNLTNAMLVKIFTGQNGIIGSLKLFREMLYSGSSDNTVFSWVTNMENPIMTLNTHKKRFEVTTLKYSTETGLNGSMIFSDMTNKREISPNLLAVLACVLSDCPFLWNFFLILTSMRIGGRRYHCGNCGENVCINCSRMLIYPEKGFGRSPKEIKFDAEQKKIICADFDATRNLILTLSSDHRVKIWDVNQAWQLME